jgi:hypothetical protein
MEKTPADGPFAESAPAKDIVSIDPITIRLVFDEMAIFREDQIFSGLETLFLYGECRFELRNKIGLVPYQTFNPPIFKMSSG